MSSGSELLQVPSDPLYPGAPLPLPSDCPISSSAFSSGCSSWGQSHLRASAATPPPTLVIASPSPLRRTVWSGPAARGPTQREAATRWSAGLRLGPVRPG